MREASNLRLLERGQTPLLGDVNPDLTEGGAGTGVGLGGGGASAAAATPMMGGDAPSAASVATARGGGERSSVGGRATTPMTLGPRDRLGLNRPPSLAHSGFGGGAGNGDDVSVSATSFATTAAGGSIREIAREERRAAKRARQDLERALASLPAPQFEYELAAPDAVTEEEEGEGDGRKTAADKEKDAADLEAEGLDRLRKEAEKIYEKRSTVLKRTELPRPIGAVSSEAVLGKDFDGSNQADTLIREEMLTLLQHDAYVHPVLMDNIDVTDASGKQRSRKDKKKKKRKKGEEVLTIASAPPPEKPLDFLPEDALDVAKDLIEKEFELILRDRGVEAGRLSETLIAENSKASLNGASGMIYLDDKGGPGWVQSESSNPDRVASLRAEYRALEEATSAIRKRADKLESRLTLRHGGYIKRFEALRDSAAQSFSELKHAQIEEAVYATLMAQEERGASSRIEKLVTEIQKLQKDEAEGQKRYGDLFHERNRLRVKLRQQQAQKQG